MGGEGLEETSVLSVGSGTSLGESLLGGHLGGQGGEGSLHHSLGGGSNLLEHVSVVGHRGGLLLLLVQASGVVGGLRLQGQEALLVGADGGTEGGTSRLLDAGDLGHEASTLGSGDLARGSLHLDGTLETSLGGLDDLGKAGLGDTTGITDSHEHELAHLGASLLGVELEALDLLGSTLLLLGDGGRDTHVQGSLGLLVHVLELELGLGHAGLTLADTGSDGGIELLLVGLHLLGKLLAAGSVLLLVGLDSQRGAASSSGTY